MIFIKNKLYYKLLYNKCLLFFHARRIILYIYLASINTHCYTSFQILFYGEKHIMVRISKQSERRNQSPHKHRAPSAKTGPLKDHLPQGFKEQTNALQGDLSATAFIPKIK